MTNFSRGDVVLVDFGLTAKTRPCVALSVSVVDPERNMSIVAPLTSQIRGGPSEVRFQKPFWLRQESVVNVLGIAGIDNAKIERRIAAFPKDALAEIYDTLGRALGIRIVA